LKDDEYAWLLRITRLRYLSGELFLGVMITRQSTKADIHSAAKKIILQNKLSTDYLLLLYLIFDDKLSA